MGASVTFARSHLLLGRLCSTPRQLFDNRELTASVQRAAGVEADCQSLLPLLLVGGQLLLLPLRWESWCSASHPYASQALTVPAPPACLRSLCRVMRDAAVAVRCRDMSESVTQRLLQLCAALDKGDWTTASSIQVCRPLALALTGCQPSKPTWLGAALRSSWN